MHSRKKPESRAALGAGGGSGGGGCSGMQSAEIKAATSSPHTKAATSATPTTVATNSTTSKPSSRHLISELSWRLVKRCTKSKVVQFARLAGVGGVETKERRSKTTSGRRRESDKRRSSSRSSSNSNSNSNSNSSDSDNCSQSSSGCSSSMAATKATLNRRNEQSGATSKGDKTKATNKSQAHREKSSETGKATSKTRVANRQDKSNNNIHSSLSTLTSTTTTTNATPISSSQCCHFCDGNDTSHESGFVSASLAAANGLCCTLNSANTNNCSDSITTAQSCSSSYCNEPTTVVVVNQQQHIASCSKAASLSPANRCLCQAQADRPNMTPEEPVSVKMSVNAKQQQQRRKEDKKQQQQQHAEAGEPNKGAKKKSFLSRARNSTINLASLANVTRSFGYSASVNNLWSSHSQQRRELADLSGDSERIKPLDYVASAHFDVEAPKCHQQQQQHTETTAVESQAEDTAKGQTAANRLRVDQTANRKGSTTKEKKRRQKEAEKVEKLRILVSYLRSGSSQQVFNRVRLEADELELAQRYKLHLILCEECLQAAERQVGAGLTSSASMLNVTNAGPNNNNSNNNNNNNLPIKDLNGARLLRSRTPDAPATNELNTIAGIVINVRRSSDQATPTSTPQYSSVQMSAGNNNDNNDNFNVNSNNDALNNINKSANNLSATYQQFNSASSPSIDADTANSSQRLSPLVVPNTVTTNSSSSDDVLRCYKCNKPTGRNKSSIMSSVDITATASVASDIDSTLSANNPNPPPVDHSETAAAKQPPGFKPLNNNNFINNEHNNINNLHSYRSVSGAGIRSGAGSEDGSEMLQRHSTVSAHARNSSSSSSNPHIGNVSWFLRHSISDPGSCNYDAVRRSMASGSHRRHKLLINRPTTGQDNRQQTLVGGTGSCSYSTTTTTTATDPGAGAGWSSNNNRATPSLRQSSNIRQSHNKMFYIDDSERKDSDTSDTTTSQLLTSSSIINNNIIHHDHQGIQNQYLPPLHPLHLQYQQQYYANQNLHHHHQQQQQQDDAWNSEKGSETGESHGRSSKATISSSEAISRDLPPARSWSSDLFLSSTPTIATTASYPPITAINNSPKTTMTTTTTTTTTAAPEMTTTTQSATSILPGQSGNNNNNFDFSAFTSSSPATPVAASTSALPTGKTSAWTNPQNLATWIDNEVNSLVNDLEVKSQLVKSEKEHVKSTKRKWLSSGSGNRRNSSGAHST